MSVFFFCELLFHLFSVFLSVTGFHSTVSSPLKI